MAFWRRRSDVTGLYHSDRGVQYLSIRYTERLDEAGIETSVGSRVDSYDNAKAESVIVLYNTRLFEPIGHVPPAEFEKAYCAHAAVTDAEERLRQGSLH